MPTILDEIATEVGVSRRLVSMVLNGGRSTVGASQATRVRVHEVARRLGYRPNLAAQAVRTGRFNNIGLLMSRTSYLSSLPGELLHGIHDELDAQGMHLSITFVDDARLVSAEELPNLLSREMVDGLLLNYTHSAPPEMLEHIERFRIPSVRINARQSVNAVHIDDEHATCQATRHLLQLGHRRVLFADFVAGREASREMHYSHRDRLAGYEQAMTSAGLAAYSFIPARGCRGSDTITAAHRLLVDDTPPTAVVCYSGLEAGALATVAYKLDLRLGQDLSIIAILGDQPLPGPAFTHLRLPYRQLGRTAGKLLLQVVNQPGEQIPSLAVPMEFVDGETVGPAPLVR